MGATTIPDAELIARLRQAVERKAGRQIRTPKDFDYLSEVIFSECHTMVSVSSLKRIWGYVQTDSSPRPSTLDPLTRYVGFADWEDFAAKNSPAQEESHPEQGVSPADHEEQPVLKEVSPKPLWRRPSFLLSALLFAVIIFMAVFVVKGLRDFGMAAKPVPSGQRVLHIGKDCFPSIDDYLSLFGVSATDTAYFQPLPGKTYVYLWGPEYGNTTWHNEGNALQLMPTITEYWTPSPDEVDYATKEYVVLANEKLYYERRDHDELRITFMRDIVDSLYVFLGIYRMDRDLSTPEKFVWRRVCDSLDLGRLNQIEQLRQ
jgi:hypothetical protein